MGISQKIVTGKATTKGKPTAPTKGATQKEKITTPKMKGKC